LKETNIKSITTAEEQERLASLWSYQMFDSVGQKEFNDLVDLAAKICETPISLISLIDQDIQFHKASVGMKEKTLPRQHSFCTHAIQKPKEMMIIDDASKDARFCDNPLVTGDPNISFYAGVPLVNQTGHVLGALCVIDDKPRKLSTFQKKALQTLSSQVVRLFELRKTRTELDHLQENLDTRKVTIRGLATVISDELNLHFAHIDRSIDKLVQKNKTHFDTESTELIRDIRRESKTATDYIKELYVYLHEKDKEC